MVCAFSFEASLFHAEALRSTVIARFPATMASSDSSLRFRYNEVSQVPLQNFRDAPPPLPRRAHLAQIESARRCWFHEHRSADHAETFNETLCRKFTCVTARLFVRQDSRTSVAHPLARPSGRLRRGPLRKSFAFLRCIFARLAVLIVCRFLYDIAPSAISSAELCLAYPCQTQYA